MHNFIAFWKSAEVTLVEDVAICDVLTSVLPQNVLVLLTEGWKKVTCLSYFRMTMKNKRHYYIPTTLNCLKYLSFFVLFCDDHVHILFCIYPANII